MQKYHSVRSFRSSFRRLFRKSVEFDAARCQYRRRTTSFSFCSLMATLALMVWLPIMAKSGRMADEPANIMFHLDRLQFCDNGCRKVQIERIFQIDHNLFVEWKQIQDNGEVWFVVAENETTLYQVIDLQANSTGFRSMTSLFGDSDHNPIIGVLDFGPMDPGTVQCRSETDYPSLILRPNFVCVDDQMDNLRNKVLVLRRRSTPVANEIYYQAFDKKLDSNSLELRPLPIDNLTRDSPQLDNIPLDDLESVLYLRSLNSILVTYNSRQSLSTFSTYVHSLFADNQTNIPIGLPSLPSPLASYGMFVRDQSLYLLNSELISQIDLNSLFYQIASNLLAVDQQAAGLHLNLVPLPIVQYSLRQAFNCVDSDTIQFQEHFFEQYVTDRPDSIQFNNDLKAIQRLVSNIESKFHQELFDDHQLRVANSGSKYRYQSLAVLKQLRLFIDNFVLLPDHHQHRSAKQNQATSDDNYDDRTWKFLKKSSNITAPLTTRFFRYLVETSASWAPTVIWLTPFFVLYLIVAFPIFVIPTLKDKYVDLNSFGIHTNLMSKANFKTVLLEDCRYIIPPSFHCPIDFPTASSNGVSGPSNNSHNNFDNNKSQSGVPTTTSGSGVVHNNSRNNQTVYNTNQIDSHHSATKSVHNDSIGNAKLFTNIFNESSGINKEFISSLTSGKDPTLIFR